MEERNKTILVIARDQEAVSFLTKHIVKKFDLITTSSWEVGLQRFSQIKNIDFVFIECGFIDGDDLNIIRCIREIDMNVPIALISEDSSTHLASEAAEFGTLFYLKKPFEGENLEKLFLKCAALPHIQKSNVQNALDYIEKHMMESITARDIAASCSLSYRQTARKFKNAFGMTIMEYVKQRRVEKAKGLLRGKAMWIGDIAEVLGFADARAFRTAFKSLTGMTPKKYQTHAHELNPENTSSQRQHPFQI